MSVCQHISSHEFYVTDGEFCHCDLHQKLFGKFNFGFFLATYNPYYT